MKTSVNFMNDLFEEERNRNKIMGEMVEELKRENGMIKKELNYVKNYINNIEAQKIKNNIIITGICEDSREGQVLTKNKAAAVLSYIDENVTGENIDNIKIINLKNKKPIVVATLNNSEKRNSILRNRNKKGMLTGAKCNINNSNEKIYVNEEMTTVTYQLLREAFKLKDVGFQFIWHKNGTIYARLKEEEEAIKIQSAEIIKQLLEN